MSRLFNVMTTIHQDQITAAEAILRPFITDPAISVAGLFLQAYNAFEDARPSRKAKAAKARQDEPEGFCELYEKIYPRKVGRKGATICYEKALTRSTREIIHAGAKRYAEDMQGVEPKFIKHLTTWLNGDHWMDQMGQLSLAPPIFEETSEGGWYRRTEMFFGLTDSPKWTWRAVWAPNPFEEGCKCPESVRAKFKAANPQLNFKDLSTEYRAHVQKQA